MKVPEVGAGICFGIGATNYRVGEIDPEGNVGDNYTIDTPDNPEEFFGQTARVLLDAAKRGAEWAVLGVPGPVKVEVDEHDRVTQNFRLTNVPALSRTEGFDPIAEISKAHPAAKQLLESDNFTLLSAGDGDLAVQAGTKLYGTTDEKRYGTVADLINGSGVGGAIARRDARFPDANLFHPDPGLWELGHNLLIPAGFPSRTYEKAISGPSLASHTGKSIKELDQSGDPIWQEAARGMGSLALLLAINGGAELVVVSGGNAIKAQRHLKDEMQRTLDDFAASANPMADKVPDLQFVSLDIVDTYEMYGARGAVVSHLTRRAIDRLVRAT